MPCTGQAVDILRKAKVHVAPAKATAAGGVIHCFVCSCQVSLYCSETIYMFIEEWGVVQYTPLRKVYDFKGD